MDIPDFDAALAALRIDPDDPADADDREAVESIWIRRTLGPLFGPAPPINPADPPVAPSAARAPGVGRVQLACN
ncbi:hypothetical protein [Saccharopolyspora spinosa]|uniref:hypothetical protein n=1 Tax=Saccharopolyspora spinosa TaxID=60894 RepID=UPI000237AD81|nr:hypothetical protein [Saccharopolyspora spinosa]